MPELALSILRLIVAQLNDTQAKVREIEGELSAGIAATASSRLLATVPGVGIVSASAIAATVTDPSLFRSGREFAAWLGMTPRQNSSGGKERLGGVSKRGDKYIRCLLVSGAVAVLRCAATSDEGGRMGARDAGEKAAKGRGARARQPDRPDRLGGDEARRGLSAREDRRARGLKGPRVRNDARVKRKSWRNGRAVDREDPKNSMRSPARCT